MGSVTGPMALTYALVIAALFAFVSGRIRVDAIAVSVMVTLMVADVLDTRQALSGFSNEATVTVAAMFVLSAGLRRTSAMTSVSRMLTRLARRDERLALAALMLVAGFVSGFVNNTATIAVLIPAVLAMASEVGISPSKLLMPMSFASILGGTSTLIGTSTNLLVNSIAIDRGLEPLGMFEFAPLGIAMFAVGFVYLFFYGVGRIPPRRGAEDTDLVSSFDVAVYVSQVEVSEGALVIGGTVTDNALLRDLDIEVLEIRRGALTYSGLDPFVTIEAGDVLWVRGLARQMARLVNREGISFVAKDSSTRLGETVHTKEDILVEVVITPDSDLEGLRINDANFMGRFGAQVLGVRQAGVLRERLGPTRLRAGTSVLLKVNQSRMGRLRAESVDFFVASEQAVLEPDRSSWLVLVILASVVGLAAFDVLPIVVSALIGCVAMVGVGIMTAEEAYAAINWRIIFLLAGLIPLGVALEDTGGAEQLASGIVSVLEPLGPVALLGGIFLLTQLLTDVISNNATAVLMTPIAIDIALGLGANPRPFVFAVAVGASMSFLTPVGYQTNTMIYGPGHYTFTDFTRVGAPLTVIAVVVGTVLIPVLWPFG